MKPLTITNSVIRVSRNSLIAGGFFFEHRAEGTLPGCRKVVPLTIMPSALRIVVRPMYGYSGSAQIRPEDWRALIEKSPVIVNRTTDPDLELTPELIARARAAALDIVGCPAVTSTTDVHPSFKPEFNPLNTIGARTYDAAS